MRVKLHDEAARNYVTRCYRHAHPECGMLHRPEWVEMLSAVQGQWLDVETAHLFSDQFNTGPIPGVSENGLRLMIEDVAEIEDDARIGVHKCGWCGGYSTDGVTCDKCGKAEYVRPLNPKFPGGKAPEASVS